MPAEGSHLNPAVGIADGSPPQEVKDAALKNVGHGVEQWVKIEKESLASVSGEVPEAAEPPDTEAIPEKLE
jgi:hypothetical protein